MESSRAAIEIGKKMELMGRMEKADYFFIQFVESNSYDIVERERITFKGGLDGRDCKAPHNGRKEKARIIDFGTQSECTKQANDIADLFYLVRYLNEKSYSIVPDNQIKWTNGDRSNPIVRVRVQGSKHDAKIIKCGDYESLIRRAEEYELQMTSSEAEEPKQINQRQPRGSIQPLSSIQKLNLKKSEINTNHQSNIQTQQHQTPETISKNQNQNQNDKATSSDNR